MADALRLTLTAAGRAALRNADGNGTRAVLVATAGLTATAFTSGDPVPNELKRVATIKGGATAADTIHVTISDTSPDVYSCRGFALYLDDGTMLLSYGQPGVIVEKSAQADMLIAVDIQFADVDATQITFGDTNFSNPAATTERMGVVELATDDEATAGTDATRVVTPKGLLAVLDGRLGRGAPTAFAKTLLAKATAAAIWSALQIKSAAGFDAGDGGGLDADLVDGQHGAYYLSWKNFTDLPATFPAAPHKHAASDITSGTFPVSRGGTGLASVQAGYFLVGGANGTDVLVPRSPDQVRDDIAAAARSHSHTIANVTGLQDALDGKAAKVHTHPVSDVIGLQDALNSKLANTGGTITGAVYLNPSAGQSTNLGLLATQIGGREWYWCSVGQGWGGGLAAGCFALYDSSGGGVRTYWLPTGEMISPTNVGIRTSTPAGPLDVVTANGRYIIRDDGEPVIDAVNTANSAFAPFNVRGRYFSFRSTDGDNRLIVRPSNGAISLDAVNAANTAFSSMSMTATSFSLRGGSVSLDGSITAAGGFQGSDRRFKKNIKRRVVQRGIALAMARMFREWDRRADGEHDVGLVAQLVLKVAPHYVREFVTGKRRAKRLSIDKAGIALECSMDNALAIQEVLQRLDRLEKKRA